MTARIDKQVMYLNRWVPREHFRAFVFKRGDDENGNNKEVISKLAETFEEFEALIESGIWVDSVDKLDGPKPERDKSEKVIEYTQKPLRKGRNGSPKC